MTQDRLNNNIDIQIYFFLFGCSQSVIYVAIVVKCEYVMSV